MQIRSEKEGRLPFSQQYVPEQLPEPHPALRDPHLGVLLMINLFFDRPTSNQKYGELMDGLLSRSVARQPLRQICIEVSEKIVVSDNDNLFIKNYLSQIAALGLDEIESINPYRRAHGGRESWFVGEALQNPNIRELYFPFSLMECLREKAMAVAQIMDNSAYLRELSDNLKCAKPPVTHFHPDPAANLLIRCLFPSTHIFDSKVVQPLVDESLGLGRLEAKRSSVDGMTTVAARSMNRLFNAYLIGALRTLGNTAFSDPVSYDRMVRSLEKVKPVTGSPYMAKFGPIAERLGILLDTADSMRARILGDLHESRLRSTLAQCAESVVTEPQPRLADIITPRGIFLIIDQHELTEGVSVGLSSISEEHTAVEKSLVIVTKKGSPKEGSGEKKNYDFFTERESGFAPMAALGISSMDQPRYLESEFVSLDPLIDNLHSALEMRLIDFWNNFPTLMTCLSDLGGPIIYVKEDTYTIETTEQYVNHFELCLQEDCEESGWRFEIDGEHKITLTREDTLPGDVSNNRQHPELFDTPYRVEMQNEISPIDDNLQLRGERRLAMESLRALGDFPEIFRVLRRHFDVRLDCSRGAGSHYMLFREGYAFTLGSKMYKRNEPFNATIGLKMLKALHISLEEFNSIWA